MKNSNLIIVYLLVIIALIFTISGTFNIGLEPMEYFTKLIFGCVFGLIAILFVQIDGVYLKLRNMDNQGVQNENSKSNKG